MESPNDRGGKWTLLTGHGHVLVEIARNPRARIRDIAPIVGLTERTVQAIVTDLEAEGYLTRARDGRRTQYTVHPDTMFRHAAQGGLRVGPFLDLLGASGGLDPAWSHGSPGPVGHDYGEPGTRVTRSASHRSTRATRSR